VLSNCQDEDPVLRNPDICSVLCFFEKEEKKGKKYFTKSIQDMQKVVID